MEAAISRSTSPVPSLLPSSKTNRVTACAATIVADNSSITERTVAASLWTGITTASCGRTEFSGAVCSSIVSRSFQEDSLVRGRRTVVGREVPVYRRLEAVSEGDLGLPAQHLSSPPDVEGAAHGSRGLRRVEENLGGAPSDEVEDRVRDLDHRVASAVAEVDCAAIRDALCRADGPFDDVRDIREVPILPAVAPDRVRVHPADGLVDQCDDRVGFVLSGPVRGDESYAAPFHPILADEGQQLDFSEDLRPAVLQVCAQRLAEFPRIAVLLPQQIVRSFLGLQRRRIDARGAREDDLRDVGPPGGLVHMVVDCEVRTDVCRMRIDVAASSMDCREMEED